MSNSIHCDNCQDTGEMTYTGTDTAGRSYRVTEACPECCEHDEHDHGICLNCGADRTDWLVGQAESAFEGDR